MKTLTLSSGCNPREREPLARIQGLRASGSRSHWLTLLLSLCAVFTVAAAPPVPTQFNGATPLEWSQRLAQSELARRGTTLNYQGAPRARWDYTTGIFSFSLLELAARTSDAAMAGYAAQLVESFVQPDGRIATYRPDEYNIDMVTPGRALLLCYEKSRDERLKTALATLRSQLATQPRTSEGGFWHKQRYPHQMWLDGLYMGSPFLADYGRVFNEPAVFDDVAQQILLVNRHTYDPAQELFYHAWDEKRAQSWADPATGHSPNFWGRAIGWYAMAIVDCLDDLPPTQHDVEAINAILRHLADGLVRWQDPASGLWWQVVDQGGREGNYLESSASSMFVYALAKGINRGYLDRDKYQPAVLKAYAGLVRDCLATDAAGRVSLTQICEVAGLGYTSSSGRPRDGSFAYYVSEPVVANDLKGVAPFILAGIEVQQLLTVQEVPVAVRGWGDYERVRARIVAPEFPARDFLITDFGARPGADATAALRAAIAACHTAGGGRVVVPTGEWLTGAIHLLSNVNLHVSAGATLRFSTHPADYPIVFTRWEGVECMNYSALIYAYGQENIAVTGTGTLDGQADWANWWGWNDKTQKPVRQKAGRDQLFAWGETGTPVAARVLGEGSFLRPNFIQPYACKNVLIEGVTIIRSPMWVIHPVLSQNVTVRGVKINSHGPNNDGCDPESSRDVLIEDCVFDTGDDCIAIKSGRNADGRRVAAASENIIVRNSTMQDGHGGVVLGSECSGDIRNVFVENCTMDSPNLDRALRFKSNAVRGGVLENVFMRDVRIGRVSEAVLTIDLLYEEGAAGAFPPVVRNVQLERVTSAASPRVLWVRGFAGAVIDGIRLSHSTFSGVTATDVIVHAGTISFDRVTIEPAVPARSLNSPTK
ncbi:MAG: glycoside hydrolase family 88 protein [Opitutaceae bacterium]|nr:glycoside hydrolase family 88 protein [Opitutaceae bacterium]MBP9914419.1 glycoside hydrolase family 88 protein [Opitutaceae bacterium]